MKAILVFLLAALAWLAPAGAQGLLPVPALTARVIDQTGTLDDIQRKGLEDKLAAFEQSKGTQVVVLLVRTTQPEDIFSFANRVANSWKIGRKEVGDGVLLVVAKDDRRVNIQVAKTLEGAIPDIVARQIIDQQISPRFRQGDFAGGLQAAVDQVIARASGEALPEPKRPQAGQGGGAGGFEWFDLVIFMFVGVPVIGMVLRGIFGRKLGSLMTGGGAGALALVFTSSLVVAGIAAFVALLMSFLSGAMPSRRGGLGGGPWIGPMGGGGWSGGGGGWGGGGGGFGSGGGGDFGGGGASGDW